jgi:membrane associated rhomboid family serine protease
MGIQDRHYYREGPGPSSSGGLGVGSMSMWSITTWLIVINVAVFVLDGLLFRSGLVYVFAAVMTEGGIRDAVLPLADYRALEAAGRARALSPFPMGPLEAWGYFSFTTAVGGLQVWRWITFQFLHASLGHIFGNMLGLYFFGSMIEQYLGRRKYLAFYLLCGIAGPIVYLFFAMTGILGTSLATPMVGASAGVFGVLMAAATVAPNTTVMLLFPPIPMKLRTLALVLLGIAAFTVFTQGHNAGGEAAHLGGAALGFLLIRNPRLLGWAEGGFRRLPGAKSSNMTYHGWR